MSVNTIMIILLGQVRMPFMGTHLRKISIGYDSMRTVPHLCFCWQALAGKMDILSYHCRGDLFFRCLWPVIKFLGVLFQITKLSFMTGPYMMYLDSLFHVCLVDVRFELVRTCE